MRKSINKMVGIRVILALASVFLFSVMMTINIISLQHSQDASSVAHNLLDQSQRAEVAHYRWSSNLSNALYTGTEFTGSTDPTTCVLGQWLYSETETDDPAILSLRDQIEPLHKQLHSSAVYAMDLFKTDPAQAQEYYQTTILSNLTTLVGLLDDVVNEGTHLSEVSTQEMQRTIMIMHGTSIVGLALALICLISLVIYVMRSVVRPILQIIERCAPLHEGHLDLDLGYNSNNELGDLANNLENSMSKVHSYVKDISRMMGELSQGNFDIQTSVSYIGDFQLIEESINQFTTTMSGALAQIHIAEERVSDHAEQLSSGAQALAQGATEQASAVQELYATLDDLSKTAEHNVSSAAKAQENARQTGEQVELSRQQMVQMVAAMKDISEASQQIGKIIATIEDIAFQTNILALNAAVEAARAGTAGKGFAVVSNEVRSLASRSDEASKATKELIDNAVSTAERGSHIVDEVSQTLQRTLELVTISNSTIGEIAEAVEGEATSIAQVTEGIGQISSVVQTNSASSEESAAVSAELFEQVHMLQEQTRRFRLKQ